MFDRLYLGLVLCPLYGALALIQFLYAALAVEYRLTLKRYFLVGPRMYLYFDLQDILKFSVHMTGQIQGDCIVLPVTLDLGSSTHDPSIFSVVVLIAYNV